MIFIFNHFSISYYFLKYEFEAIEMSCVLIDILFNMTEDFSPKALV